MDERQSRGKSGEEESAAAASVHQAAEEQLGEKMKKIEMKAPSALGLLARNAALLPSGIVRVKQQLRNEAPAPPSGSSSASASSATGNPRNKTALAPGHSLMDWIRLGSSGVDLTGVGGKLLSVTPAELAKHNTENDAWIAIRGIVFNVSRYMSFHPGGVPELMRGVGKDATKLFDDVHAWVNYQSILQKCVVGKLERSAGVELLFESDKAKPKKSAKSPTTATAVPEPAAIVKMDWRQTSNTVSMFYSAVGHPIADCRIKRLADSELELRIRCARSGDVVAHAVKLAEDVEWPPNCQRSSEASEIEIAFRKRSRGIWKKYGSYKESRESYSAANRGYSEYSLLENRALCRAVHLLVLRAENYMQIVPAGRHVEAKLKISDSDVSRLYTPVPSFVHPEERAASSPLADDCLCLMVKRYEDGAMSPSLTGLGLGDKLWLSSPMGDFVVEDYDGYAVNHLLAAGTGLTVMLPIVKRALARRNPPSINLVNFNRDEDSIFYRRELDRVAEERKLIVTHVLSAAGDEATWSGRRGQVSEELLRDVLGEATPKACVFTCGPPAFMEVAGEYLRKLGWQSSQMHEFEG